MKKESWDMEHIDSDTTNPLIKFSDQKEWLTDCLKEISDDNIKREILQFIKAKINRRTLIIWHSKLINI